ncbi:TetR/AcrR family transcriptional regulator [Salimicrobium flavidum]|uniref:Transcriptional regulator, TetR family n=1 Tax=Salimicrobium flavidum TaxID=570947 RepID=A0A1N7IU30_9BACI|nr:TetR/AcrR family transcriptional regulator [Salimicrobium flavidum]SIS40527.1 transcriptional regulator, TetR family [Salimicrobium flavidum]
MDKGQRKAPGRPRTSEQKQPTYEAILQSAATLFMEFGYQRVSIDDVAHQAGVTKATVYYYYETKADLFTKTMEKMMENISVQMEKMLEEEGTLYEKLLRITDAHLKATFHIDLESILRETKTSLSDNQLKATQEAEEAMNTTLEKAFTRAMETGEVPDVPLKFAVQTYVTLLRVGNYRDQENLPLFPTTEETAQAIVDFYWRGMFPN